MGVLPGAGAGRPGVPGDRNLATAGTYHVGNNAMVAQRDAVVGRAYAYPNYSAAMYAGYPGAWVPRNVMGSSLYANPGYGALAAMLGMAARPNAYDYGGNVVVQPQAVYVNGDQAGTPEQYADQASQIAAAGADEPGADARWQPLGVFAMVEPDQAEPNDLFQLAVSDQGTIRGNYQNVGTGETIPVAGSVDPQSQRAAWTIGGDTTPVYEAGIANLATDQATMLVHAPDGQQSQFNLVRLPEPPAGGQPATRP